MNTQTTTLRAMDSVSLLELQSFMRRVVALNFGEALWLRAEISQVNESRGHYYLTLVEKSEDAGVVARASGMIWAKTFRRLKKKLGAGLTTLLQDGREVLIQVQPQYSEVYGFSLHVEDIDPAFTLGQLELERQQTIERLNQRGLLTKNKQLELAPVLQRLAVISSSTAAGLRDYNHELRSNAYGYSFDNQLFTAAMQGDRCPVEVPAAFQQIKKLKRHFDAVLLIRGGGSRLDLASFDDQRIGEAVARCPLPVITGLGHEQDTSVADLCAHTALKTPTAVGQFVLDRSRRYEEMLLFLGNRIERSVGEILQSERQQLARWELSLRFATQQIIQRTGEHLDRTAERIRTTTGQMLEREKQLLDWRERVLRLTSPEAALERGFARVRQDGKLITRAEDLETDQPVVLEFRDGKREIKSLSKSR